jgi:hypothetical protein
MKTKLSKSSNNKELLRKIRMKSSRNPYMWELTASNLYSFSRKTMYSESHATRLTNIHTGSLL